MNIVEDQRILCTFRNAYPVVRSCHRGEVQDHQDIFLTCFIFADKAEDTSVPIVGIDPLETVPVAVQPVKGGKFAIQMEKVTEVILQILVERLSGQMPVQCYFFVPFVELAEVLAHEQQFFTRVSHEKCVSNF